MVSPQFLSVIRHCASSLLLVDDYLQHVHHSLARRVSLVRHFYRYSHVSPLFRCLLLFIPHETQDSDQCAFIFDELHGAALACNKPEVDHPTRGMSAYGCHGSPRFGGWAGQVLVVRLPRLCGWLRVLYADLHPY